MNDTATDLFSPLQLGELELRNRAVMAPLTRNRAAAGNVPTQMNAEYYRQRAGAGLIITEATQVSPHGIGYPATPGIHDDAQVAGWKLVTDAVHGAGGLIFLQLWYCGRISHPDLLPDNAQPVSASSIRPEGEAVTYEGMQAYVEPRALETEEMPGIVEQYRHAARCAKDAGFDGVEIHAANGYLIDQFLRDGTNRRSDRYGGSVENRSRLLMEVLDAVAQVWEPRRIGVRISPENRFNDIADTNPQETFGAVAAQLAASGIGYLHVVEGDMMSGARDMDYDRLRDAFNGVYMANNGYDLDGAQEVITSGKADLVSFGKLYLANPDLVERFRRKAELNVPDPETFYGGDEKGYTDYPAMEN